MAFAIFLSVIAILVSGAVAIGNGTEETAVASSERYLLSYEALCADTAAGSLHGAVLPQNISAVPSLDGRRLHSAKNPQVSQVVFHKVTVDYGGRVKVQEAGHEPV
ncbi:MAG: hypothetical protein N3G22_01255 [Candidatus Micrarchaeota archaeon]|nr:hypothetical protein [Candidatus Micrarchaeota archaeon]